MQLERISRSHIPDKPELLYLYLMGQFVKKFGIFCFFSFHLFSQTSMEVMELLMLQISWLLRKDVPGYLASFSLLPFFPG